MILVRNDLLIYCGFDDFLGLWLVDPLSCSVTVFGKGFDIMYGYSDDGALKLGFSELGGAFLDRLCVLSWVPVELMVCVVLNFVISEFDQMGCWL